MCIAESERDQWRGIIDEIAAVMHPGSIYNSRNFPAEIAEMKAALSTADAARDALATEVGHWQSRAEEAENMCHESSGRIHDLLAEVERLKDVHRAAYQLANLTPVTQESNPGPDAPSQERATGAVGSAPKVCPNCSAMGKAIESFRWSCGICHHGWDTPIPDNAALRQRVFEHIGNLILNEKAGWGGLSDLVAQFDLLGRDL